MSKIYCINCQYLIEDITCDFSCFAPQNIREQSNWLEIVRLSIDSPQNINKHNDCTWFTKKEDEFKGTADWS